MSELSEYILEQLRLRGWPANELAKRANLSPSSVGRIIHDDNPGFGVCLAVAQVLHVDPVTIFRKAGLLPAVPETTTLENDLLHALRQLPIENQHMVLSFVQYFLVTKGTGPAEEE